MAQADGALRKKWEYVASCLELRRGHEVRMQCEKKREERRGLSLDSTIFLLEGFRARYRNAKTVSGGVDVGLVVTCI